METDIQRWIDDVLTQSQDRLEYWSAEHNQYPEDFDGVLEMFSTNMERARGTGILLTGSDTHGSQGAAVSMLTNLLYDNCECVLLDGMELGQYGATQAKDMLAGLLNHFSNGGARLCLLLERMEQCPCRQELLYFLGTQLWKSRLHKEYLPLFLILIDNLEHDIPSLLRNCLRLCRTNIPNQAQRAMYLEKYGEILKRKLSLEQFAQLTEGANYTQLRDMIWMVNGWISFTGDVLTQEELAEFLEKQMPSPPPEDATLHLGRTLDRLIEQLPKVLSEAPLQSSLVVATQQSVPAAAAQTSPNFLDVQEQASYLAKKHQEIENMPPMELCARTLDEN